MGSLSLSLAFSRLLVPPVGRQLGGMTRAVRGKDPREDSLEYIILRMLGPINEEDYADTITLSHSVLLDETTTRTGDLYIRSICFSPDGKLLATGAEDRQIRVSLYIRFFSSSPFIAHRRCTLPSVNVESTRREEGGISFAFSMIQEGAKT